MRVTIIGGGILGTAHAVEAVCRAEPEDDVWVITDPGGRGMTLGPAIAEQTADVIGI
jgi:hypothetical protein